MAPLLSFKRLLRSASDALGSVDGKASKGSKVAPLAKERTSTCLTVETDFEDNEHFETFDFSVGTLDESDGLNEDEGDDNSISTIPIGDAHQIELDSDAGDRNEVMATFDDDDDNDDIAHHSANMELGHDDGAIPRDDVRQFPNGRSAPRRFGRNMGPIKCTHEDDQWSGRDSAQFDLANLPHGIFDMLALSEYEGGINDFDKQAKSNNYCSTRSNRRHMRGPLRQIGYKIDQVKNFVARGNVVGLPLDTLSLEYQNSWIVEGEGPVVGTPVVEERRARKILLF